MLFSIKLTVGKKVKDFKKSCSLIDKQNTQVTKAGRRYEMGKEFVPRAQGFCR